MRTLRSRRRWLRTPRPEMLEARLPLSTMLAAACEEEMCPPPLLKTAVEAAPEDPGGGGHTETLGNNLSYPVVWSESVAKALRGTYGTPDLRLEDRWAQYTLEDITRLVKIGADPVPDEATNVTYVYQQQGESTWQAQSAEPGQPPIPDAAVEVSWIDWGDNLESVDWYTRSKVRVETVLLLDLDPNEPMVEYQMMHLGGRGQDELHGVVEAEGQLGVPAVKTYSADYPPQATVYSHAARLTIQKLNVEREDPSLEGLIWNATTYQWEDPEGVDLVNAPLFNGSVAEGGDGPGYYSAEINVKGKVIYGYNWDVRNPEFNEGPGDYRLTFSLDADYAGLNTFFTEGITEILVPAEEEEEASVAADEDSPAGGGTAQLDFANNLTFIDVRIKERGGGRPTVRTGMGSGGMLIVTGDEGDNHITISGAGNMLRLGATDTDVEGPTEFPMDQVNGLRINMGAGNDSIRIGGEGHEEDAAIAESADGAGPPALVLPGTTIVNLGPGDDLAQVSFIITEGHLRIVGASGEDEVVVGRGPRFSSGHPEEHAADELRASEAPDGCGDGGPPPDVTVRGSLLINTGEEADKVKVGFTSVLKRLDVRTMGGDDLLIAGRGPMKGGAGGGGCESHQPEVLVAAEYLAPQEGSGHEGAKPPDVQVRGPWFVSPGEGNDMVVLRRSLARGMLTVLDKLGNSQIATKDFRAVAGARLLTGNGHDAIALLDSYFGRLLVSTLGGADEVLLRGTIVAQPFLASMGAGNDQLVVESSIFRGPVRVHMGAGSDKLAARDNVFRAMGVLDGAGGADRLYADDLGETVHQMRFAQGGGAAPFDAVLREIDEIFGPFLPGKLT